MGLACLVVQFENLSVNIMLEPYGPAAAVNGTPSGPFLLIDLAVVSFQWFRQALIFRPLQG